MTTQTLLSPDAFAALVGTEIGVSPWRAITQAQIDEFAQATDDHQFIHVDPERARATPFGGTIAHGMLALSLLASFSHECVPRMAGVAMGINYGFDRVRFVAPVRSGASIRARFLLTRFERRAANEIMIGERVTIEIENETKPALVADWLGLFIMTPPAA